MILASPRLLPMKTREYTDRHMDSTAWNMVRFRADDIVIASYPKSGTTWLQQIVAQLIFKGAADVSVTSHSTWIESRALGPRWPFKIEAQRHRRFFKTHLPVDALVFSPKAKYLYIGRDGRDVAWSLFNHLASASDAYFQVFNSLPGHLGPPLGRPEGDVHEFYSRWFEGDGYPTLPYWQHVRSWWNVRALANVKPVHYNALKADLKSEILTIAEFLGIAADAATLERVLVHCSFDYMKENAALMAPGGPALWQGGGKSFVNQGSNGRWRDILSTDEVAAYEAKALAELGAECAIWLANGGGT